jgi:phospholipid transport system substrate-binding protein
MVLMAALLLAVSPLSQAATPAEAQALVKETADKVLDRLAKDHDKLQRNPEQIYPLVEDLVLPHFDFERMSQWVLGASWRQASPDQRQRFTVEFRNLLVRTYAKALLEYTDQTVTYLPLQAGEEADRVVVRTQIEQKGSAYPIPINYAMYQKAGSWKVYDITVDNVSLVSNYRTSFASEIRQGGLDQLIARLGTMNKRGSEQGG